MNVELKKVSALFTFLLFISAFAFSQQPHDLLNDWQTNGSNKGCKQWKITWPTGDEEKDLCSSVDNNRKEFYYTTNNGNGIVFRAPIRNDNGTTPNSNWDRCSYT